ncbi:MAG: enoyl-CoA hydratase/isomerase family protein, partial [Planctomycetes bacterium]|nr:enoyl-CoA hydratase/isomerase family protein [Planctomycetota bacterium]
YDVDAELNRAVDWLKAEGIGRVILTGDFHLSTQMAGADISEFFPALSDVEEGRRVAATWSATARRFHNEFKVSVGFAGGKRCLGGFLELLSHCHYLVALDDTALGMPEVTLPVLPGMEGCHWPFRKTKPAHWPRLVTMLLTGKPVKAKDAVDWLIDYSGPIGDSLKTVWSLASGSAAGLTKRKLKEGPLEKMPADFPLPASGNSATEAARHAIMRSVRSSCGVPLSKALDLQARLSADFTVTSFCREGTIGTEHERTMLV